ncbi:MAG: Fe-S cluster assembly protein SufB, partial [Lachnospiraceae bacterium]|nr:Fe-S cluster assembly protein SufB [Lachnospiraceae bacterium]
MKEKAVVSDINRSMYDFRYSDEDAFKLEQGLTPEIVAQISKEKNDPEWMADFRQKSLEIYNRMEMPNWGPSIEGL